MNIPTHTELTEKVRSLELLCAILRQQLDMKNEIVNEMHTTIAKARVSNSELLTQLSKRK